MKKRWEFRRYDHRDHGIAHSRGFLHYIGFGHALFIWGFHRGVLGGYGYGSRWNGRAHAWFEFTFYIFGECKNRIQWSIYPGLPIPRRWL